MKLRHIITEDVKTEQRLVDISQHLAKAIYKEASGMEEYVTSKYPVGERYGFLDKIRDIVDSKVLGPFYGRLGMINVFVSFDTVDENGEEINKNADVTVPAGKETVAELTVFYNAGKGDSKRVQFTDLHETILHELRHALDFSITKGKGHISTPRKGTTGEYGHYDDFRFPHEINARVTGAMAAVRTYIVDAFVNNNIPKKDIDIDEIIRQALDDENLVDIFKTKGESEKFPFYNKNFRQIYNRVLKYTQSLIDEKE